jgi:hypothetical protein
MATYQEQIERLRKQREQREKAAQLSKEQVEHWRIVLANMSIPFAMTMPAEMIQEFRDRMQASINNAFQPDDIHDVGQK